MIGVVELADLAVQDDSVRLIPVRSREALMCDMVIYIPASREAEYFFCLISHGICKEAI